MIYGTDYGLKTGTDSFSFGANWNEEDKVLMIKGESMGW